MLPYILHGLHHSNDLQRDNKFERRMEKEMLATRYNDNFMLIIFVLRHVLPSIAVNATVWFLIVVKPLTFTVTLIMANQARPRTVVGLLST